MKRIALIFPGQGSQYPGMGKEMAASFAQAKETFEEADDLLAENLSRIILDGPENELTKTKNSQLGIFVVSAAILRALEGQIGKLSLTACSGLSLGEYTALWASGRLSFRETLFLIRERARLMNEACETRAGAMAAVLGLNEAEVLNALKSLSDVWVANYNCPGQIVISGTKNGVNEASAALKNAGAKRVLPLQVSGAFHSGLMQSAQDGLKPFIERSGICESKVPFVMNVPGDFVSSATAVQANLISQVTHSVRWEQGILAIEKAGVDLYVEIGCGKTLSGLNRKIGVESPTISIEKLEEFEPAASQMQGAVCSC